MSSRVDGGISYFLPADPTTLDKLSKPKSELVLEISTVLDSLDELTTDELPDWL